MSTPRPASPTPAAPTLRIDVEQLRHQAKDLRRAAESADADTLARVRRHHPRLAAATPEQIRAQLSLQEAQHVIAREQGFDSWPKLVAAVGDADDGARGDSLTKDELRGLARVHESLAQRLRLTLRHRTETRPAGSHDLPLQVERVERMSFVQYQASQPHGWSYSFLLTDATGQTGGALFDLPVTTARRLVPEAADVLTVASLLADIEAGRRSAETPEGAPRSRFPDGMYRRMAGIVCEDIEEAWEEVLEVATNMHAIQIEPHLGQLRRSVVGPQDRLVCVTLAADDGDPVLRLGYPCRFLGPLREALTRVGAGEGSVA